MKVLLTMNLPYFPAHGGANKSNRALAEGFAKKGHHVRIVVPALGTPSKVTHEGFIDALAAENIRVQSQAGVDIFNLRGVEVHAVREPSRLRSHLVDQIAAFEPDWILVSAEDPSQNVFDAASKAKPGRVVYIVQTPTFLPFGPQAFFPSERRTNLLGQATAVVALSKFTQEYINQYGGMESTVIHMPVYGAGPFANFGNFDHGFVTLVNPCQVKGISIFTALARALPDIPFAAVPTWGTTPEDIAILQKIDNVTLLEPKSNFDDILSQTRLLLMPSLWQEAFGFTTVEAMLRGIPVIASDVGGLPEAKLGTEYLLPVRPIERFTERLDSNHLPIPEVPDQDIGPWRDAVSHLLRDRAAYEHQSRMARDAASRFIQCLGVEPYEELFERLEARERTSADGSGASVPHQDPRNAAHNATPAAQSAAGLTPEQQALLMMRLRKKASDRAAHEP